MSDFWQNWMKLWCLSAVLFGLILLGAAFQATTALPGFYFEVLDGPVTFTLDPNLRLSLVVLGAVMIGWGLTAWTAIYAATLLEGKAAKTIWIMLTGSVVCWFLIDSALSIHTGFERNAIINIVFFLAFLIPVVRSGVLKS